MALALACVKRGLWPGLRPCSSPTVATAGAGLNGTHTATVWCCKVIHTRPKAARNQRWHSRVAHSPYLAWLGSVWMSPNKTYSPLTQTCCPVLVALSVQHLSHPASQSLLAAPEDTIKIENTET